MKAFKSFRGWMHRVFAATLRTAFPTLAVKFFTLKNRANASDFLPGEEKELKAITKLNLSDEEIAKREWSSATRIALIKQGKYIQPKSEAEFDAFLATKPGINVIIEVMKSYTPSSRKLREMLDAWQPQDMVAVISAYPQYFADLKPWEILGVEEGKPYYGEKRWNYVIALVNKKSELAPAFMQEVINIPPRRLCQKALEAFKAFWEQVYCNPKKVDVSKLMSYLYVFYPEYYMEVRRRCQINDTVVGNYVREMLPQFAKHLGDTLTGYEKPVTCLSDTVFAEVVKQYEDEVKVNLDSFVLTDGTSLMNRAKKVKLNNAIEARLWLDIAIAHLGEEAVMTVLFDNWSKIEPLVSDETKKSFYRMALSRLRIMAACLSYTNSGEERTTRTFIIDKAIAALDFFPEDTLQALRRLIADNTLGENLPQVKVLFPFSGWEKDVAEKIVRLMAKNQKLPVDRMDELTEELKAAADEELEIASELAALENGNLNELLSIQLHPRTEREIFAHIIRDERSFNLFAEYVSRFRLSDEGFYGLILTLYNNCRSDITSSVEKLIEIQAQKHKLTVKRYRLLMQSDYKSLAPLLKRYVEGNENLPEDTDEAEIAEQPEESAPNSPEVEVTSETEDAEQK